jgi:hypothetical protein
METVSFNLNFKNISHFFFFFIFSIILLFKFRFSIHHQKISKPVLLFRIREMFLYNLRTASIKPAQFFKFNFSLKTKMSVVLLHRFSSFLPDLKPGNRIKFFRLIRRPIKPFQWIRFQTQFLYLFKLKLGTERQA